MEKTKISKRSFLSGMILIFMIFVISISGVVAIEQGTEYIGDTKSVSISDENPMTHMALKGERYSYFNYLLSSKSDVGVVLDQDGDGGVDEAINLEENTSPQLFPQADYSGFQNGDYYDPWDYYMWLNFMNTTEYEGDIYNISVSAAQNHLGSLNPGDKKTFQFPESEWAVCVIAMDLDEGVYNLIAHYATNLNFVIVTPNNKVIWPTTIGTVTSYANGIKAYGNVFAASEKGVYQLYMFRDPSLRDVPLELVKYSSSNLDRDKMIEIKDGDLRYYSDSRATLEASDIPLDVYKFEVAQGETYKLDFIDHWGSSTGLLFMPLKNGAYTQIGVTETNTLDYFQSNGNGIAYLVIYNEDFWYYSTASRYENRYCHFTLEQLTPMNLNIGTNHVVSLDPRERQYLKFNIATTSILIMKAETLGSCTISGIYKPGPYGQYAEAAEFECPPDSDYWIYLLSPATYFINGLSTSDDDISALNITTELIAAESQGINVTSIDQNTEILPEAMTSMVFEHFEDVNEGGQYYPKAIPFSLDENTITKWRYNFTWFKEDNNATLQGNGTDFDVRVNFIQKSALNYISEISGDIADNIWSPGWIADTTNETSYNSGTITGYNKVEGWLLIQPYDVAVENGSWDYYSNDTFTLRVGISDYSSYVEEDNYGTIGTDPIDLADVPLALDEAPYNESSFFSYSTQVNATEKNMLVIQVNSSQPADWYKFIVRANNTSDYDAYVASPDNVWVNDAGPNNAYNILTIGTGPGTNENMTAERGIAMSRFYVVLHNIVSTDSDFDAQFWLEIRAEHTPIVSAVVVIETSFDLGLALGIGFGIGGVVVIGLLIWRKRKL